MQVEDSEVGWIYVEPSTENFVVNTGQAMGRWTNDAYKANNHRVKLINVERISIPFFVSASHNTLIDSFNHPLNKNESIKYSEILYGEHIAGMREKYVFKGVV